MNQQQTIDWLQARLTSAEDTTLSQTRFMAQMTIERSNLEANNKRLQGENERLRALVEDAYYEGWDDAVYGYGRDWLGSDSAAALQPEEDVK